MGEYGTYVNPNPRPYQRCDAEDLIKLSSCFNDVLSKLDICVADDLACECCALQNMDQACFHLCPTNPSANFLNTLVNDCSALNDVNACSLPFMKFSSSRRPSLTPDQEDSFLLKSKIAPTIEHPSRVSLLFDYEELASLAPAKEKSKETAAMQPHTSQSSSSLNSTSNFNSSVRM